MIVDGGFQPRSMEGSREVNSFEGGRAFRDHCAEALSERAGGRGTATAGGGGGGSGGGGGGGGAG